MITHEFLDQLKQMAENAHEARNEKLLERTVAYLEAQIQSVQLARKTGKSVEAKFLQRAAEVKMNDLRTRADYWKEKAFREEPPQEVVDIGKEAELLWIRTFRKEYELTGSTAMANMVADQKVLREYDEPEEVG